MEMVRHSPRQTAMALRAASHRFFKEVDATMVGALSTDAPTSSPSSSTPARTLRLAREIEDLHLDPLSMVQNTQKQEAGDEVWRASDYGGVVRTRPRPKRARCLVARSVLQTDDGRAEDRGHQLQGPLSLEDRRPVALVQYWYDGRTNAILNLQPQQEEISGPARSPGGPRTLAPYFRI